MTRIQYTGTNYNELKQLFGDRLLAPYDCMGFSMLSLMTEDGPVTIHEGNFVTLHPDGQVTID
ncbi:MAG: hypothetical protein J6W82_07065 [Bacteroidales bacterium]|nr:hypothetical protein [Bacteroidales bacterium]